MFIFLMFFLLFISSVYAVNDAVFVRPHFGIGVRNRTENGDDGICYHAGARFLVSSNTCQKIGLEVTYIDADTAKNLRYTSVGMVMEQRLWDWVYIAFGTLGYLSNKNDSKNPFGIVSNIGWEPDSMENMHPYIIYRSEIVFDDPTVKIDSISLGFTFKF